ncbi:ABC transporter substrate-binding protein [Litorisediminicola beolgyonensis]|uniref:ABC transporter substrate-binding protein n=1 Tax=Litorisediminicola beolgyonensis TaxID=1173614 RepID=A0ABW3ZJ31_9RHOB
MHRRRVLAGASAVLLSAGAGWSLPQGLGAAVSGRAAKNPLRGLVPEGCAANLAPVQAAWSELTGQPVELQVADLDGITTQMMLDRISGLSDYDFALPATFGLPDLVAARAIQPFAPLAQATGIGFDAVASGHLYTKGDVFEGARYGAQTDGDVYLMFYRRDLADQLEQATGTRFAIPSDWPTLDGQMEALHRPDQEQYGGVLFRVPGYLGWEYLARLDAEGHRPFDEDFEPQFNSEAAFGVLEAMRRSQDHLHPASLKAGLFENWEVYRSEKIFANIGWGGSQKAFNAPGSPLRGKLLHGALPPGAGRGGGYFNWGWSYVVPTHAAQPEAAYLFAMLAMTDEVSTRAIRESAGFFDPFLPVHYGDDAVRAAYSDPFLEVHRAAMARAAPDLYLPGHINYMSRLNAHLAAAMDGSESPRTALALIASEWRVITVEMGAAAQKRRWRALIGTG